jgi:hypothetical protein
VIHQNYFHPEDLNFRASSCAKDSAGLNPPCDLPKFNMISDRSTVRSLLGRDNSRVISHVISLSGAGKNVIELEKGFGT